MNRLTSEQAELLLRLADLLDEMAEEEIRVIPWGREGYQIIVEVDGVHVMGTDEEALTGDDIRGITA